jgi:signal transduction histidine kinase
VSPAASIPERVSRGATSPCANTSAPPQHTAPSATETESAHFPRRSHAVRLAVRDRGIGIAPEEQGCIFDRFERAVSVRHYGGFGLGLWIVRQMAEALGGAIRVESRPGEGAAFTVELPR